MSDSPKRSHQRAFSIDLSLALERQLDNESLPPTPSDAAAHPGLGHDSHDPHDTPSTATAPPPLPPRQSLDPHVLASLVTQLRDTLAATARERDDLKELLAQSHTNEAGLTDALQHMTDKCTTMDEELTAARAKLRDNDDAIVMLRNKVEESRRGLMRLQTENRRQSVSQMSIDVPRAGHPPFSFGGSPASRRTSFAPVTGSLGGHRRIASVSDSGLRAAQDLSGSPFPSPGGAGSDTVSLYGDARYPPPAASRRFSGVFGRASPPNADGDAETDALRRELRSLRDALEETRAELTEAREAKEASDTCVTALRAFIEEHGVGVTPAAARPEAARPAEHVRAGSSAGGWGFKLWKGDAAARSATPPPPAPPQVAATVSEPLARKIGGFFGARSNSVSGVPPPLPPRAQEPVYNGMGSDTSSIVESLVEPVSPLSDDAAGDVVVRDVGGMQRTLSLGAVEAVKVVG